MPKRKVKKAKKRGGNRTKWTPKKKEEFLDHLRTSCNVTLSARAVGLSRSGAYEFKDKSRNRKFSKEWDEAIAEAIDVLEGECRRRAYSGVAEPIHYKGQRVDTVQKYSDVLLIFLLKAHRPAKYREKYEISGPDEGPIEIREIRHVIVDAGHRNR